MFNGMTFVNPSIARYACGNLSFNILYGLSSESLQMKNMAQQSKWKTCIYVLFPWILTGQLQRSLMG